MVHSEGGKVFFYKSVKRPSRGGWGEGAVRGGLAKDNTYYWMFLCNLPLCCVFHERNCQLIHGQLYMYFNAFGHKAWAHEAKKSHSANALQRLNVFIHVHELRRISKNLPPRKELVSNLIKQLAMQKSFQWGGNSNSIRLKPFVICCQLRDVFNNNKSGKMWEF